MSLTQDPPPEVSAPNLAFLGGILDTLADPVFVKDRSHRFVMVNQAFCTFAGRTRAELIGRTDRDFFPAHEVEIYLARDEEVFLTGRENLNDETLTTEAGRTHDISTKKTLYIDADGRSFIIGIIRDMTEIVAARGEREALVVELQQALAEVRTLRDFLPICVYCHKVRDDQNYWSQLETYLHEQAGVVLSHGVCPECNEQHVRPMMEELRTRHAATESTPAN